MFYLIDIWDIDIYSRSWPEYQQRKYGSELKRAPKLESYQRPPHLCRGFSRQYSMPHRQGAIFRLGFKKFSQDPAHNNAISEEKKKMRLLWSL